jgi:thermostable 8-oxoguanine DNA glycosylase
MAVSVELPDPDIEVMDSVPWGQVNAFPTPAFWAYQVVARRLEARPIRYKLGSTLREEVGACLLGGHGIPASVGLAAFEHLRGKGAFAGSAPDDATLTQWLSEPLAVGGRQIRYRFARQKAGYLARSLVRLDTEDAPTSSGRALRDWLLASPGIGHKTASWIARNWMDADDVAILDIHILRAGVLAGVFAPSMTVERDYMAMEQRFIAFSQGLGVRASELDAVIWYIMMSAPGIVKGIVDRLPEEYRSAKFMPSRPRAHNRGADTAQLTLLG